VGTEGQVGIENVLSRFGGLRDIVARITNLREALKSLSSQLPTTPEAIDLAKKAKASLAEELASLVGSGLNDDVISFLRRSVEGVPLSEVLAKEDIINWLKENNLSQYFRVRTT
jgi:hypothetical protein